MAKEKQEGSWFSTTLQNDIWEKKYCNGGESVNGFFDRISGNNKDIRELIINKKFLPGGRILASRGLQKEGRKITYSNCYVITPPEDNIESIFECATKLARTYSYGGGCGIDISGLAPTGARINNAAKETTGSISFMDLYSLVTDLIGQAGRRGALMISLDCKHPDLMRFIDIKTDLDKVTKANISIRISDDFMKAVKADDEWTLSYTREETGQLIETTVNANDIMNKLAYNNWDMAEPGALFWDRITSWNLLSNDENFKFAGVNPCAEEPLPAGGSCLLGSISLAEFVKNPFTPKAEFDFKALENAVGAAVIYLNEILEEGLPLHPLAEQRESVNNWKQIGLGIMGLGDALLKLGIKYGSAKSLAICDKMGFAMANAAIYTSAMLAKEKGTYPMYREEAIFASEYFNANTTEETKAAVKQYGMRNSQLLTIAPTGSISTMLGISGGIEPIYDNSYVRKTESLHGESRYYKVFTPIVKEYMDMHEIADEADLPDYFVTAMTLNYKERIEMQSVWQKHIDASISSTVNVPNSFTVEDVKNLYILAWEKGLKGVTLYRDGCRRSGILVSAAPEEEPKKRFDTIVPVERARLGKTYGTTSKYKTSCGSLFITINRDKDGNIVESFVNTSKSGICKSNIDGINRMISLALRSGIKVEEIVDQLKYINCPACVRSKAKGDKLDGLSCPDIIARALQSEYNTTLNFLNRGRGEDDCSDDTQTFDHCPECGEPLKHEGGCVTCTCGWSRCM